MRRDTNLRNFLLVILFLFFLTFNSMSETKQRRRHTAADGSIREYNPDSKQWELLEQKQEVIDTPPLAIEGRRFEYMFSNGDFQINNIPLFIIPPKSVRESTEQTDGDTGRSVWDAAVVLAKHLESNKDIVHGKRILELGAGTGLAGLAAAVMGGHVDISDLPYCLPAIETNINATNLGTSGGSATALKLNWESTNFDPTKDIYDVILGADIVWLEHLVQPLVKVMEDLLKLNPNINILLGHQTRSAYTDELFFSSLAKKFTIQKVKKPDGFQSTKVNLFHLMGKGKQVSIDSECKN